MAPQGRLALVTVAAVLFLCVGTALAAAPGVLYGAPTNVTQSGAVLQGSINPSDKTTTYYFEYGTSTAYGAVDGPNDASQVQGVAGGIRRDHRTLGRIDVSLPHRRVERRRYQGQDRWV